MLILDWTDFEVTSSGILEAGKSNIGSRDQSMTAVSVIGHKEISGYQSDLSGGALQDYDFGLTNIALIDTGHLVDPARSPGEARSLTAVWLSLAASRPILGSYKVQPGNNAFTWQRTRPRDAAQIEQDAHRICKPEC